MGGVREHDRDNTEVPILTHNGIFPKAYEGCCDSDGKGKKVLPAVTITMFIALAVETVLLISSKRKSLAPATPLFSLTIADPCEDDWIWYRKKCYYFSSDISEWEKSQDFCSSRNASLAIITSTHELDFILRYKGSPDHWIGLRRESEGKPWVWTNGSAFGNMFTIVGLSDCVLVNSGRISSASCYSDKYWVCNKPDAYSPQLHF